MDDYTASSCVTTCLVIFTLFIITLKLLQRRNFSRESSKFLGPSTLPFIGNAHLFAGSTEAIMDRLNQLGKRYPSPYRLWLGNHLMLVVNTPEQFKVILHSPKTIDKGTIYYFIRPWLGTGLLTASATKWREHRRLIQPTFSATNIQSFVRIFSARSVMMTKEMGRNLDGPEFDIYNYTSQCALHTICETTMGVNLGAQENSDGCYAEAIEKVIASACRRAVSPWLHKDFIFHRTQLGKDQQKYIKFLHTFTDNVIQAKKNVLLEQSHRPGLADTEEDTGIGSRNRRKKILLDYLIEESHVSKKLTDEAIREEVDTIMVAGSDTTAVQSCYVMLMLASHPEVQDKVHRELCEIYQVDDCEERHVTWEDLTRMTYLERVIKETMRLFPVSPTLVRSVTDDLEIGEHTLPAGSSVLLSMMDLHRNGEIWPDPLKFDPDRFLPEEIKQRDSYTYLPFSSGPKSCIGSKYAMISMKTLLATILRKYVLKKDNIIPVKDIRLKWEFLLRPVDPITIRIEKRSCHVASIFGSSSSSTCQE